jgi:hypothetical protein
MTEHDEFDDWRRALTALLCDAGLPTESDLRALFDDGLTPAHAAREILDAEQDELRWDAGQRETES